MTRERFEQANEIWIKIDKTKNLLDLLDNSLSNDTRLVLYKYKDGCPTILNEVDNSEVKEPLALVKECVEEYIGELENKFMVI